jgi:hypothetical protein
MATAEQLKALVQSYTAGDQNRFMSVAMQIAAHAARTGKEKLAADLQKLIDEARKRHADGNAIQPVPIARPGGDLAGLVAATNYHGMLDHALFRRFDDVVQYTLPNADMARHLIENRLSAFNIHRLGWKSITASAEGLSHAEIVTACEDAAKDAILADSQQITTAMLTHALRAREGHRNRKHDTRGT